MESGSLRLDPSMIVALLGLLVAGIGGGGLMGFIARTKAEERRDADGREQAALERAVMSGRIAAVEATVERLSQAEGAHTAQIIAGISDLRERLTRVETKLNLPPTSSSPVASPFPPSHRRPEP